MTVPDRCEIEHELEVGDLVTPRFQRFEAMGIVTKVGKRSLNKTTNKVHVCWYHSPVINRGSYSNEEFVVALFKVSK